jgi:hypothetical protein
LPKNTRRRRRHFRGGGFIPMSQRLIHGFYVDLRFGGRKENVKGLIAFNSSFTRAAN